MKTWFGTYYSGSGADGQEATVLLSEKKISIGLRSPEGHVQTLDWKTADIKFTYENSRQASVLQHIPTGSKLQIESKDPADTLEEIRKEDNTPWHKKSKTKEWSRNGAILASVLGLLVLAYFIFVPWFSERLSGTVSIKQEEQFGNTMYDALGLEAKVDSAASRKLNDFFREMNVQSAYTIRLSVVNENITNAFAMPGGHIVVYSALLHKLDSYPQLAALLSHEFIHVNNRHTTRSIFRKLGSKVFLGLLLGKMGGVGSVLADQADDLKSLGYSRKLEQEADREGLQLLLERNIDPEGFSGLFTKLKEEGAGRSVPEFLASHPEIDTRIKDIRSRAGAAVKKENTRLQFIFDQLKNSEP